MTDRARHDVNLVPTLAAVSNADGETPVSLWANPNTHALVGFSLMPGVDYDFVDVEQTSTTVETYLFYLGGLMGTLIQTVIITYTSDARTILASVEYS